MIEEKDIWKKLEEVKDPEIPLVSVIDMGMITKVEITETAKVKIQMTPTFAGCPAIEYIKNDIAEKIKAIAGCKLLVEVEVNYDTAWNTNMITARGRELLRESRFALPGIHSGIVQIEMLEKTECPNCGSTNTRLMSAFGATQCRAVHYCDECLQIFEQIKPV